MKPEEKMHGKSCWLSDEEVEKEIERLNNTEEVALARCKDRLDYTRRRRLYLLNHLCHLYKRGEALREAGITREMLEAACDEVERRWLKSL